MTLELFLRGLAIGFAIAFALGPIGLLVIRRTVDRGWAYGFLSGVGVATADALYGAVAAFGITAVTEPAGRHRPRCWASSAARCSWSSRSASLRATLRATAWARRARRGRGRLDSPVAAWASMVALTATNPATILSFAALFASHRRRDRRRRRGALAVVAGVFTGSVAWWALLTGLVAGLRARLTPRVVRWLNIVSAALIGGFGVVAIAIGVAG